MLRLSGSFVLLMFLFVAIDTEAQCRGEHIPAFTGLNNGTQPPPGFYQANIFFVYPTDTMKDDNGRAVALPGSITTLANVIILNGVTNYKVLGANFGANVGIVVIKNRLQFNAFNVSSGWGFSDSSISPLNLGWNFKRA